MPRLYCGVKQINSTPGIITVAATITTRAAAIGADLAAHSNAWVGADNADATNPKWAQFGYLYYHPQADVTRHAVYVEVQAGPNDDTDYYIRYFNAPPAGDHRYSCILDEIGGEWLFFFDRHYLASWQHNGWRDVTASKCTFTGEVNGDGSTLVGAEQSPCTFSNCEIEYQDNTIVKPNFMNNQEWGVLEDIGEFVGSIDPSNQFDIYQNGGLTRQKHGRIHTPFGRPERRRTR
jgi:hypothetical protein